MSHTGPQIDPKGGGEALPVMVMMPLALTPEMLRAVRKDPLTSCENKDEENRRIGWLLCAWDVLIERRVFPGA